MVKVRGFIPLFTCDTVQRAVSRCLDEAIKDRLYIHPLKRERLIDSGFKTPAGKPILTRGRRISRSNSLVIVFEADGSITKLHPV